MRMIKASDRPRDVLAGEDVVTWAVRTGRILAASSDGYRRRLDHGEISEQQVETLAPVMAGQQVEDVGGSHSFAGHPARSGEAYAASPTVDRIRRENPMAFRMAIKESPAPKLFGINHDRDLPLIMASGLDPAILLQVPWQARHRIAAEGDRAKVYHLLEAYADDPDAAEYEFGPGSGSGMDQQPDDIAARSANSAYESACFRWAAGTPIAAVDSLEPLTNTEYEMLFQEP